MFPLRKGGGKPSSQPVILRKPQSPGSLRSQQRGVFARKQDPINQRLSPSQPRRD